MRARSKSMSAVGLRQPLLGALLRRLGARDVDLVGLLGDLRQDRDPIGLHFGEPERDQTGSASPGPGGTRARRPEQREQRRVPRQDAEIAVGAGDLAPRRPAR